MQLQYRHFQKNWGGLLSDYKVVNMKEKPIEAMTKDERDIYFRSFSGLSYDEFQEKYKDDTPELILSELHEKIKKA